jgi:hypothetical protein
MKSVLVDGYGNKGLENGDCPPRSIEIPSHLQSKVDEIWFDPAMSIQKKHEEVCLLLRINRFFPDTSYKSYAVCATKLSFFSETKKVGSCGGWYECAYCHLYISIKPPGNACPQCKRSGLTNYDKKPEPLEVDWGKYYVGMEDKDRMPYLSEYKSNWFKESGH